MSLVLLLWSFFFQRRAEKLFGSVQTIVQFNTLQKKKKTFDKNDNRNLVMPDLFNSLMLLSGSGRILLFFCRPFYFFKEKVFQFSSFLGWMFCIVIQEPCRCKIKPSVCISLSLEFEWYYFGIVLELKCCCFFVIPVCQLDSSSVWCSLRQPNVV